MYYFQRIRQSLNFYLSSCHELPFHFILAITRKSFSKNRTRTKRIIKGLYKASILLMRAYLLNLLVQLVTVMSPCVRLYLSRPNVECRHDKQNRLDTDSAPRETNLRDNYLFCKIYGVCKYLIINNTGNTGTNKVA